jgi:hypothetical protein
MRGAAAIVVMLAGCSFSHGSLGGDGSTTSPEAGPGGEAAVDAALPLIDDGLLVRYFIDEASSGQTPTQLVDSAPSPLPLDLHYTTAMSFAEPAAHQRALRWTMVDDDGRASIPVNNTKISSDLDPSDTFTIELVIDLRAANGGECRFLTVAEGLAGYGAIALVTNDLVSLNFHLGTSTISWSVSFTQRLVLHLVVDTTQTVAADRVLLFVNGEAATRTGGTSPSQNYDPPILINDYLTLGGVEGAGRSMDGDLYYAAIYTKALTPAQVATNVARLAANDDL